MTQWKTNNLQIDPILNFSIASALPCSFAGMYSSLTYVIRQSIVFSLHSPSWIMYCMYCMYCQCSFGVVLFCCCCVSQSFSINTAHELRVWLLEVDADSPSSRRWWRSIDRTYSAYLYLTVPTYYHLQYLQLLQTERIKWSSAHSMMSVKAKYTQTTAMNGTTLPEVTISEGILLTLKE